MEEQEQNIKDAYKQGALSVIKNELISLPERIRTIHLKVANQTFGIEQMRKLAEEIRQRYLSEITRSVVQDGGKVKPQFSNEEARRAELDARLKLDPDYPRIVENLLACEKQTGIDQVELEYLNNLFKAHLALAEVTHPSLHPAPPNYSLPFNT